MSLQRIAKWLPRRFSVRTLLLIALTGSCFLAYRLQPFFAAQRFVGAKGTNKLGEVLKLTPAKARKAFEVTYGNIPDDSFRYVRLETPTIPESRWEVIWKGKSHANYTLCWGNPQQDHSMELTVEFTLGRTPTVLARNYSSTYPVYNGEFR